MKHKHYDMIVAKAANMELVVFARIGNEWYEPTASDLMMFNNGHDDYFLCLPQHKEACLYWLNGGDVQERYRAAWSTIEPKDPDYPKDWRVDHGFMQDSFLFRIKPKKEKRWIVIGEDMLPIPTLLVDEQAVENAKRMIQGAQFFEIEVEV